MAQPEPEDEGTDLALGPFVLPQPDPLSENQATDLGKDTVQRIFSLLSTLEQPQKQIGGPAPSSTQQKSGFSRLAASSLDRDSWLTLLTRLATRGTVEGEGDVEPQRRNKESVADSIRNLLYRFVLEQFRGRINVAISWMNEEWYNDKIRQKAYDEEKARREADGDTTELTLPAPKRHYDIWVVKMMEGFMPYLDSRDNKVLIRFLSETPELTQPLIEKVKTLANDPERVNLCVQAFHYLVLFRPPSRNACLDALESLYQTVPEARPLITKILAKWRPAALPQQDQGRQQQPPAAAPTAGSPPGAAAATPAEASAS
ncbi:hypothetical protein KEM55_005773 [Ascosphaera atra]|nr:hypothetical protein KEM55_005773 [Ascosphaera atra]